MTIDMQRDGDSQGDMDFLRGASHALAAMENPHIKHKDAVEAVRYLRMKAACGEAVPPLMWFLVKCSNGYYPRDAYDLYMREEATNAT